MTQPQAPPLPRAAVHFLPLEIVLGLGQEACSHPTFSTLPTFYTESISGVSILCYCLVPISSATVIL